MKALRRVKGVCFEDGSDTESYRLFMQDARQMFKDERVAEG